MLLSTIYPPFAAWLFDLERKTLRRQTFEGHTIWAIWGPDADHLTFDSDREGSSRLYWKPVDAGPGGVERLASGSDEYPAPSSWSPDAKKLAFVVWAAGANEHIWIVPRSGEAEPFLRTRFNERYPEFSPDGRWLVYSSDESGRDEVYVRPYPGPGHAIQISTVGGSSPGWSRDGSEIFYHTQAASRARRRRLLRRSDHDRRRESASGHTGEALRLALWRGDPCPFMGRGIGRAIPDGRESDRRQPGPDT